MNIVTKSVAVAGMSCLLLSSCKKDKDQVATPQNPNENETLTTLMVVAQDTVTKEMLTFQIKDLDGDGGLPPSIKDTLRFNANSVYDVEIRLLDETKTPAIITSDNVKVEADQHQFFFSALGNTLPSIAFEYLDKDKNGVPLGLKTRWKTGIPNKDKKGLLKIILKHQPDEKPKSGNGDITKGSTDIEVYFPIIIK